MMTGTDDGRLYVLVKCSGDGAHLKDRTLHGGTLPAAGAPAFEWDGSALGPPATGEPGPDGDRKVIIRCPDCNRNPQVRASLLATAVRGLADAGLKDHKGRVVLDIAKMHR
jgi:hypothetical protein